MKKITPFTNLVQTLLTEEEVKEVVYRLYADPIFNKCAVGEWEGYRGPEPKIRLLFSGATFSI
jgi:hypothetical protein